MWEWISDPTNQKTLAWIGGAIAGVVWFLYTVYSKMSAKRRKPKEETGRGSDRQAEGSITSVAPVGEIVVLLEGKVDFSLQVFAQRLRPCRPGEHSEDNLMIDENGRLELTRGENFFRILKKDLLAAGYEKGDPYKFFCRVPNEPDVIYDCYALLCDSDYIVTGKGREDPTDSRCYQIWFVSGREPTYPNPVSLYFLNNQFEYRS